MIQSVRMPDPGYKTMTEDQIRMEVLNEPSNIRNLNRETSSINDETLKEMFDELYILKGYITEKEYKMESLVDKLYVEFEGNNLKGSYSIRFNHFPPPQNDVQKAILKATIQEYGLELSREKEAIDKFIELLTAISTKQPYCEVDLFSKEKEKPVEC